MPPEGCVMLAVGTHCNENLWTSPSLDVISKTPALHHWDLEPWVLAFSGTALNRPMKWSRR
eukprot:4596077-Alexandrium_andersonii.AAC.1